MDGTDRRARRLEFEVILRGAPTGQPATPTFMHFSTTQKRAFTWVGLALAAWLLLWALKPVLAPFVVAAVLALLGDGKFALKPGQRG